MVCYAIGGVGLAVWVFVERAMGDEALIPMRLFRSAVFSKMSLFSVLFGMGWFGAMMMIPLYLQIVKGVTPTRSGLLMLPLVGGMLLATLAVGRVIRRTGRYKIFPGRQRPDDRGDAAVPLPRAMEQPPAGDYGLYGAVGGRAWRLLPDPHVAMQNAVGPRDMGVATASANFFRQIGSTAGTAIFLSLLFSTLGTKIGSAFTAAYQTPIPAGRP